MATLGQVFDVWSFVWSQVAVTDRTGPVVPPPFDGDTWGMSGPAFVRAFALALMGTALVAFVVRWRLDARRPWMPGVTIHDFTPTELAFLASGRPLVAVTVVWDLWRNGHLHIENAEIAAVVGAADGVDGALLESPAYTRAARATRVSLGPGASARVDAREAPDPIEEAVLDVVREQGEVRPHVLSREVRRTPAMDELEASLEHRGFIRSNAVRQRMMTAVALVFAPVALVGVARVVVGLRQGEPVGNLLVLLVATALLLGVEVVVTTRPVLVTEFVQRASRRQIRGEHEVIASLEAATPTLDEARALALLGVGVLWHANPVGAATLQAPTAVLIAGTRVSMEHSLRVGSAASCASGCGA